MYVCSNCKCPLADQQNLIYRQPMPRTSINGYAVNVIQNVEVDKYSLYQTFTAISCRICKQELGMKIDQDYCLYEDIVIPQQQLEQLNIAIISIKKELLNIIKLDPIRYCTKQYTLLKKELDNIKFNDNIHGAVIIHQIESRVLLLGRNGLYNYIYQQLWQLTGGNVLLVLIDADYSDTTDPIQIITELTDQGQQPLLALLYEDNKIVFSSQIHQIPTLLQKFHYRCYSPLIFVPNMPKSQLDVTKQRQSLLQYYLERIQQQMDCPSNPILMRKLIIEELKTLQSDCIIF